MPEVAAQHLDPLSQKSKAWSGRFSEPVADFVLRYTASVDFDKRMALADIAGSIAHATMMNKVGVLADSDLADIKRGMAQIVKEIQEGQFQWKLELEDVHLNVEARLTQLVGDAGKRLHTGRSRNDQVATDMRLYMREEIDTIIELVGNLQEILVAQAEKEFDTIMPGFTHMQVAQPVTLGHHFLAYVEMFERDRARLIDLRARVNQSPLGAAALAGTTYPIDREYTAELLGFESVMQNSLDAVSDRDFCIEFTAAASILMMHISRLSEELIYWMSQRFKFMMLPDRFTTGSSIMPQKKNPDVAETTQEDKEPVFDAIDTVKDTLRAFVEMMPGVVPNREEMKKAAQAGYPTATDLADYLTKKGLPFREAHDVVGSVVKLASNLECDLAELTLEQLKDFCPMIEEDVYEKALKLESSVAARDHLGGTAPAQVKKQVARWHGIFAERHAAPAHKRLADLLK